MENNKYWYNSRTGEVEYGTQSPGPDRIGPFDTEAEAQQAPATVAERARAWAAEDSADDAWGTGSTAVAPTSE